MSSYCHHRSVDDNHGKDEVPGSNPGRGSIFFRITPSWALFVVFNEKAAHEERPGFGLTVRTPSMVPDCTPSRFRMASEACTMRPIAAL